MTTTNDMLPAIALTVTGTGTLDDETRASNLPEAITIATRIMALIGTDHPQVVSGVKGTLALQRIAFDDALVQSAIAAAKAS